MKYKFNSNGKSTFFYLILTLLFITNSNGQSFSLKELIDLNFKNVDAIDTFVVNKGYEYSESKDDVNFNNRKYNYNRGTKNKAEYWLQYSVFLSPNSLIKNMVTWQTLKREDYIAIKNQLKTSGFKFIDSKKLDSAAITYNYSKGKIIVSILIVATNEQTQSASNNQYLIDVSIKK